MYNLLLSGDDQKWDTGYASVKYSRFLQFSENRLVNEFKELNYRNISRIKSLPVIFGYENRCERAARVGWITNIEEDFGAININFRIDRAFQPIEPTRLISLSRELGIEHDHEIHTTHWAIKDVDLINILTKSGLLNRVNYQEAIDLKFSRTTIVSASNLLKSLSHSELDEFILEVGVEGLNAPKSIGGRQARATEIGRFTVDNPDAQTPEGEYLSSAVVKRAALLDNKYPNGYLHDVSDNQRNKFWQSLEADGYLFDKGEITPISGKRDAPDLPSEVKNVSRVKESSEKMMTKIDPRKVFIVHGRKQGPKDAVARFLAHIGLTPLILHEEPSRGQTLFQKFQDVAASSNFAVVIMTPDDIGGLEGEEPRGRARQNVIFELGFFIAKLGPQNVCVLVDGDVEKPSDYGSVVYVPYGDNTNWKADLARELRAAGMVFNAERVF